VTRDAVADYIAAGETFVGIVEGIEAADRDRVLGDLAIALADLYSAAGRLPASTHEGDDFVPGDRIDTKGFFEVLSRMAAALQDESLNWNLDWEYWGLSRDALPELINDLADDLAETYLDVKDDIAKLAHLERRGDAVWEVRESFWTHTGNHAVSAMRLLHAYVADNGGTRPPHDPSYQRRAASRIDLESLPEEELGVRTRVARHLAQVAAANGQDQASAFRSAFTMNYDAAERLRSYVAPLAEGAVTPLNEEERRYLEGLPRPE
jgi:hypothetical protein